MNFVDPETMRILPSTVFFLARAVGPYEFTGLACRGDCRRDACATENRDILKCSHALTDKQFELADFGW